VRFKAIALLGFSVAALALAGTVSARQQTTTPGVVYVIKIKVTDRSIVIPRDKFSIGNVTRYPRGAVLQYRITNLGSKPYVFQIWGTTTAPIRPGKHDSFLINWNYRGSFHYGTLLHGKPTGHGGTIIIF
jgi:hypothetical protein